MKQIPTSRYRALGGRHLLAIAAISSLFIPALASAAPKEDRSHESTGSKSSGSKSASSGSSRGGSSGSSATRSRGSSGGSSSRGTKRESYRPRAERSSPKPPPPTQSPPPSSRRSAPNNNRSVERTDYGERYEKVEVDERPPRGEYEIDPAERDRSPSAVPNHKGHDKGHGPGRYWHGKHGHGKHYGHYGPHHCGCGHYGYCYSSHSYYFGGGYPWLSYAHYGSYSAGVVAYDSGTGSYGDHLGALDLDIKPQKSEVFLDGRRIGTAGEFDGYPSYLWLEPGIYDLAFYREGYETLTRQYTIYKGVIIDVDDRLRKGVAIHPDQLAPVPIDQGAFENLESEWEAEAARRYQERISRAEQLPTGSAEESISEPTSEPTSRPIDEAVGLLVLHVEPEDAAIYLDGTFIGTAGELAMLGSGIPVQAGEHEVEIMRPSFVTEVSTVEVPIDGSATLKIEMEAR